MVAEASNESNANPEKRKVKSMVKEVKRTRLEVEEKPEKDEMLHGDSEGR
jgi:Txe/YoeB family toxin of Txe-Axe toxin-antitoxin module